MIRGLPLAAGLWLASAAAGYLIGRWSPHGGNVVAGTAADTLPRGPRRTAGQAGNIETRPSREAGAGQSRRTAPDGAPVDQETPTILLSPEAAATLVRGELSGASFDEMAEKIGTTLDLMGAPAGQKEAAAALMRDTAARIRDAEKGKVKVKRVEAGEVTLDLSGAKEAVDAIAARAREDLRRTLGRDLGPAFADGISWDRFYLRAGSPGTTISLTKTENALLLGITWDGFDRNTRYLDLSGFPDHTSIPAGDAFGGRWSDVLEGIALTPGEEP